MKSIHAIFGFMCLSVLLVCGTKPKKAESGFPLLDKLQPANQYFHINPLEKNILRGEKGSIFTIDPDSFTLPENFQRGDKLEVHIIEVNKSLEFGAVPVSLEFRNDGADTLFESAGMFFINVTFKDKQLSLAQGKTIEVKFRTDIQGKKFHVYAYDAAKGWERHGHNQEIWLIAKPAPKKPAAPAKPAVAAPARAVSKALYRLYKIDKLTWWNFDYPQPDLTCIQGKIVGSESKEYSVTIFSKSKLGAYTLYLEKDFKISFYRNTTARIFAIDEKGNVARSDFFETPDEVGHHKLPESKCEDIDSLKIQKIPKDIAENEGKLRKFFQKAGDGT